MVLRQELQARLLILRDSARPYVGLRRVKGLRRGVRDIIPIQEN